MMFCSNCYAEIGPEPIGECPNCHRKYNARKLFGNVLSKPFPSHSRIVWHIILTTVIGLGAAFVIGWFQLAAASGH